MSERLSRRGIELKGLCDSIAEAVSQAVGEMVGTAAGGTMVRMGADGTPTKSIDKAAEDAVLARLQDTGLGFRVLSEEIGEVTIGDPPYYFLHLDPLDGTFNAIKGIPFYSVSIYLSKENCHFGYVCDIAHGCSYYAESGKGAYVETGSPLSSPLPLPSPTTSSATLRVSKTSILKDFSVSAYTLRPNTARITGIGDTVRRIRTLGSTSLEMSLVASGALDAFIDLRGMLRVVDIAAGKLILEEAGGLITDAAGKELHLDGNMWQRTDLIGSNGLMHDDLLNLIGGGEN
ncbi:MAG: bifunctional fructose-bisphosphatase/inositol-phosphate phosphatase [Methanothrix sp.]|nr:bifunctional fructose-bisphosphatase/inositol-phosphate phosphatase [Methanothrix sp.]